MLADVDDDALYCCINTYSVLCNPAPATPRDTRAMDCPATPRDTRAMDEVPGGILAGILGIVGLAWRPRPSIAYYTYYIILNIIRYFVLVYPA